MTIVKSALQLLDQLLDLGGRDRIERRAGSSIRMISGFDRDGARDAEALLLAAGQTERAGRAGGPSPRPRARRRAGFSSTTSSRRRFCGPRRCAGRR